jgi:hypothetical protein
MFAAGDVRESDQHRHPRLITLLDLLASYFISVRFITRIVT